MFHITDVPPFLVLEKTAPGHEAGFLLVIKLFCLSQDFFSVSYLLFYRGRIYPTFIILRSENRCVIDLKNFLDNKMNTTKRK